MDVSELIFRKAAEADIDYLLWLREVTMNQHIGNSGLPTTREKHLERIKYEFDKAKIILINEQLIDESSMAYYYHPNPTPLHDV